LAPLRTGLLASGIVPRMHYGRNRIRLALASLVAVSLIPAQPPPARQPPPKPTTAKTLPRVGPAEDLLIQFENRLDRIKSDTEGKLYEKRLAIAKRTEDVSPASVEMLKYYKEENEEIKALVADFIGRADERTFDFSRLTPLKDSLLEIKGAVSVGINNDDYMRRLQSAAGEALKAEDRIDEVHPFIISARLICYRSVLQGYEISGKVWDSKLSVEKHKAESRDSSVWTDLLRETDKYLTLLLENTGDLLDSCKSI